MVAKVVTDFALGKLKGYAVDRGERYVNENLTIGPQALKHVKEDVEELLQQALKYKIRLQLGESVISNNLDSDRDHLSYCMRAVRTQELDEVNVLRTEIERLSLYSEDVKLRLSQRYSARINGIKETIDNYRDDLQRASLDGSTSQETGRRKLIIIRAEKTLYNFEFSALESISKGEGIASTLAAVSIVVDQAEDIIRNNRSGFIHFFDVCHEWLIEQARVRNGWGG